MTTTPTTLRCSAWARAAQLDPIGSAGSYRGFLLVELPLPWPRDVGSIPEMAAVHEIIGGLGLRVQGLVPTSDDRRVIVYLPPPDDGGGEGFAGFQRREAAFGDDLPGALQQLLAADSDTSAATGPAVKDLLICTHGSRDTCCGASGTRLYQDLQQGAVPDHVRAWRTSHTGGHRFAPTCIVLPEATCWAFADLDLLDRVLHRRGDARDVADRYRGCAGLGGPQAQALEREVLRQVGWELFDARRVAERDGTESSVRLRAQWPGGRTETWEAEVLPGRDVPVPDCGRPIEESHKTEREWVVRDVRQV
jgi:hypothetical protein